MFIVQLCMEEGVRLRVYRDLFGHLTVGVGHRVKSVDKLGVGAEISLLRCVDLLEQDMQIAYETCQRLWKDFTLFPTKVQLILCDMAFNLGAGRLRTFKNMVWAVDQQQWSIVADEMAKSRWYKQVGTRAVNLVQRMREVAQWSENS